MNHRKVLSLLLAMVMLLSLAGFRASAEESYSFTANGFGGDVTVTLTVDGGKILSLTAEGPYESEDFGAKGIVAFNRQFAAFEGTELDAFDPAAVDAYTGASTTSKAVFAALNGVLAQAADSAVEVKLADGEYTELEWGFSLDTQLPVTVQIADGKIAAITPDFASGGETGPIAQTILGRLPERIIAEQSLAVDAISGATATSNAVKRGVIDALTEAMLAAGMDEQAAQTALSGWYTAPSYLKTDAEPIDITTQVLVVGAGGTGSVAAYESQKTGAETLVIETSGKYGGTGALTTGPMTVNAISQVEQFGNRDIVDADAFYKAWLEDIGVTEDSVNAAIIRDFMATSAYHIDWLSNNGFAPFGFASTFKFPAYQVWSLYDGWMFGATHGYFANMMEKYTALGGKTMFETTGKSLLLDGDKVVGVEAVGYDGQVYHIYADAVILATGGFAGSAEYLKELTKADDTGVYQTYGILTNVGTAITMARQVDGRIADNADIVMAHFAAPVVRIHEFDPASNQIPTALVVNQSMLAVNTKGERFLNEVAVPDDAGDETNRYLAIWGSDQLDEIRAGGFVGSTSGMYMNPGRIAAGTPIDNLYDVLDFCVDAGFVWKAESPEALAAAISADTGMSMESLVDTIARYNELAAAGEDTDFGKAPNFLKPVTGSMYYAVAGTPVLYSTASSVVVDEQMRLVTNSGGVIENLFVGSMDSCGMVLGEEYIDYGAVAQSWAFYSGRVSGMNAAELALNAPKKDAESYVVSDHGDNSFNVYGKAPVAAQCLLANVDDPVNGLNYVVLELPAAEGAASGTVSCIAPILGEREARTPGTVVPVEDGVLRYALQVNGWTATGGGVLITVDFDNGESVTYTVNTDLLLMADDTASEDVTAAAVEAAAADPAFANAALADLGTVIRKAAADEDTVVYTLGGTIAKNTAITRALGAGATAGTHDAVLLLEAPEGFEAGTLTVNGAVSFLGNEMSVSRPTMQAVNGGAVYVQSFVPAVYAAGRSGGESLVTPGTLSEKGVVLSGTWDNGTETKDMTYIIDFGDVYMDFYPIDMGEELAAVGIRQPAQIRAFAQNAYNVSEAGLMNVMLVAPDPFFGYATVTYNGTTVDASLGRVIVTVELAPGENVIDAVWTGRSTTWGAGADYPVSYTFVCP